MNVIGNLAELTDLLSISAPDSDDPEILVKVLCEQLGSKVKQIARFKLKVNSLDSEDIAQEVLVQLITYIAKGKIFFQTENQFWALLNRIALQRLVAIRGRSRAAKMIQYDTEKVINAGKVADAPDPYAALGLVEDGVRNLDELLNSADLTEQERTLLKLQCDGIHYTEIARELNVGVSKYYKIWDQAIKKLAEVWRP